MSWPGAARAADCTRGRLAASHCEDGMRLATFLLFALLCACQGWEEGLGRAQHELCSREWWRNAAEAEVEATVRSHGDSVNAACDDQGNRPVHLALSVEGILSEDGFHGTAMLIRAGAELSAVNRAGESAVTLAEDRFRHMLARWDAAVEKLCQGIDVMDQAVQRERWENSIYYLVRTDSGLETLEEVRTRTNARRERPPDCTG